MLRLVSMFATRSCRHIMYRENSTVFGQYFTARQYRTLQRQRWRKTIGLRVIILRTGALMADDVCKTLLLAKQ